MLLAQGAAEIINDPQVKVVAEDVSLSMPAAPPSKLGTEMFTALTGVNECN
jgi:hypothetical protein